MRFSGDGDVPCAWNPARFITNPNVVIRDVAQTSSNAYRARADTSYQAQRLLKVSHTVKKELQMTNRKAKRKETDPRQSVWTTTATGSQARQLWEVVSVV